MWQNAFYMIAQVMTSQSGITMNEDRPKTKPVNISINTNRQLVYAKYVGTSHSSYGDWLILIHNVETSGPKDCDLIIMRLVSYDLKVTKFNINESPQSWGTIQDYEFYTVTDEERKMIAKKITKHGYKYVRTLNKLIPR